MNINKSVFTGFAGTCALLLLLLGPVIAGIVYYQQPALPPGRPRPLPSGKQYVFAELPPSVLWTLENAVVFQVMSLDGERVDPARLTRPRKRLHGYGVLEAIDLSSRDDQLQLLKEFQKYLFDDAENLVFGFEPGCAIHAEADGQTADLVICYMCGHVGVYENGNFLGFVGTYANSMPAFEKVFAAAEPVKPTKRHHPSRDRVPEHR